MKKYLFIVVIILLAGLFVSVFFAFRGEKQAPVDQAKKDASSMVSATIANIEKISDAVEPKKILEITTQQEEIVQQGESAVDPLLAQISNQKLLVRSFAVSSLVRLGHELGSVSKEKIINGLKDLVEKEINLALQRQTATGLMSLGEKSSIPTVIDYLESEEVILFSEPPELLSVFCLNALKYYTDQDFQDDQSKWQSWWRENQGKISWDQNGKKFIEK